ncbi:sporulation associated protein [Diplodia corticola]|uniref:Sporulation associated protein n=1 Tax=Diplodia corticola TaxID=236234 RepID=A0A1J9RAN3_9PEZI|nr:sporulation associated protein [Diplodia corticola]OJD38662.1 sporulation associated protein [Diplodia corticola]
MLTLDARSARPDKTAGIGTYIKGQSKSAGWSIFNIWPAIKSAVIKGVDQALGTSFEDHVLSGYRFIMRHYCRGDHIYIFGFSRGAYTARFLAEMVQQLGLLSRGNDDMVRFAWETFSNWQVARGHEPQTAADAALGAYMDKFKGAFCRPDVRVHFLGLFDCVNSVGQFEIPLWRTSYRCIATPAAQHIRHAVSIHERRLKFKPALFTFDAADAAAVDLKEVWFAGNHADVGGGWNYSKGQTHLLSDTPLNWMVQESLSLPDSASRLAYKTTNVQDVVRAENAFPGVEKPGTTAFDVRRRANQPHDMLKFFHGVGVLSVLLWWILEILPIFTRLELEKGKWVPRRLPPNLGAPRDIPVEGVIHSSVNEMIKAGILDEKSVPEKGGDNPLLPNVAGVLGEWTARRERTRKMSGSSAETLVERAGEVGGLVKEKLGDVGEGIEKGVDDVKGKLDGVGKGIEKGVGDAKDKLDGVGKGVEKGIESGVGDVKDKLDGVGKGVESGVEKGVGDAKDKLNGVEKGVEKGASDVKDKLDGVEKGVESGVGDVKEKLDGVGKGAKSGVSDVKEKLDGAGKGVESGVEKGVSDVKDKLGGIGKGLKSLNPLRA